MMSVEDTSNNNQEQTVPNALAAGSVVDYGEMIPRSINVAIVKTRIENELARELYPDFNYSLGNAGFDLRAMLEEPLTLEPGANQLIGCGLALWIENPNLVGLLMPRSGLGHKHGIVLGNLTGVIDSVYQGETKMSCWNRSAKPYTVQPGEKIAQILIMPVYALSIQLVDQFDEATDRGSGGFGHTGRT